MLAWCSGLECTLTCVLGPRFNSRMVHFFSSTNNIIKSLPLLFCIDLYYYFYYSNIGCWGFQVESTWNLSFHMESTWNPHGNGMEFMWNIPYGFQVEISYGMVESTWNIGGRKSPKWVRSQPKHIPCGTTWIPCGTTWIPYGFHMESMWNKGAG